MVAVEIKELINNVCDKDKNIIYLHQNRIEEWENNYLRDNPAKVSQITHALIQQILLESNTISEKDKQISLYINNIFKLIENRKLPINQELALSLLSFNFSVENTDEKDEYKNTILSLETELSPINNSEIYTAFLKIFTLPHNNISNNGYTIHFSTFGRSKLGRFYELNDGQTLYFSAFNDSYSAFVSKGSFKESKQLNIGSNQKIVKDINEILLDHISHLKNSI